MTLLTSACSILKGALPLVLHYLFGSEPGEVLLKQFGCRSKYDLIIEVVELLEANPTHARIWFRDGREDSVAPRHLACFPRSDPPQDSAENILPDVNSANLIFSPDISSTEDEVVNQNLEIHSSQKYETYPGSYGGELLPSRSSRIHKPVQRLDL